MLCADLNGVSVIKCCSAANRIRQLVILIDTVDMVNINLTFFDSKNAILAEKISVSVNRREVKPPERKILI